MINVTHRISGLVLTDHTFRLPLDYAQPQGEQLEVFARKVVAAGQEIASLPYYRVLLLDQCGTGRGVAPP